MLRDPEDDVKGTHQLIKAVLGKTVSFPRDDDFHSHLSVDASLKDLIAKFFGGDEVGTVPMRSPTGRRMTNWSTGLRRNILECLCLTRHRFLTCPRVGQRHWSHCPSTAEPVAEELQEDAQAAVEEPPVDAKTHRARKRSSAASCSV